MEVRIVITGSTGFLGRYVTEALQKFDCELYFLGRSEPRVTYGHYVECDIIKTDLFEVLAQIKPTHLIHLAWYAEHGKFWRSPKNIDWMYATQKLVHAFLKSGGLHVIVSGSSAEYSEGCQVCDEETSDTLPTSIYGIAKCETRHALSSLTDEFGARLAWAHIFYPYGIGEPEGKVIPSIFKSLIKGNDDQSFTLDIARDFIHASDVASALEYLTLTDGAAGRFNVSVGRATSLETIIKMSADYFKIDPGRLLNRGTRLNSPSSSIYGSNDKLKKLGWNPSFCFGDYMREFSRCYRL